MRIISGSARGTKLVSLDSLDTRPTLDRVKEAVFSSILSYIYNANVLDLFAGSGALGLEALSRGAKSCVFVDNSEKAKDIILTNIKKTHMEDKSELLTCDFQNYLDRCNKKFDIVFLDPPYATSHIEKALEKLGDFLNGDAIVVAETLRGTQFNHSGFEIQKEKAYGKVSIFILVREKK